MAPFFIRARFHHSNKRFNSQLKNGRKHKKGGMKNMQERFEKLRAEMEEISMDQQNIRQGQRQVREKFEGIETECEELKRETRIIIQQSARTQIKLALMFQILKASEQADHATVATLTHLLRYLYLTSYIPIYRT
ncbi:hypothetical protein HRI_000428000 [Hibiscus trionum]|uniref:Uncharacterized protein n=1 Tax=Hibiscus trionum TaxID=183268 RepID=A0A9W7GYX0_HIBTR|nr:hypothetical protein HRI_000428000 [Hibiscus trionum]